MSEATDNYNYSITSFSTDNINTFVSNENSNWKKIDTDLNNLAVSVDSKVDLASDTIYTAKGKLTHTEMFPPVTVDGNTNSANRWPQVNYIIKEEKVNGADAISGFQYTLFANGKVDICIRMYIQPLIKNERADGGCYSGVYTVNLPFGIEKNQLYHSSLTAYTYEDWRDLEAKIISAPVTSSNSKIEKVTFGFKSDKFYDGGKKIVLHMHLIGKVSEATKQTVMQSKVSISNIKVTTS